MNKHQKMAAGVREKIFLIELVHKRHLQIFYHLTNWLFDACFSCNNINCWVVSSITRPDNSPNVFRIEYVHILITAIIYQRKILRL